MSITRPSPLYDGTRAVTLGLEPTVLVPPGSPTTKVHIVNIGERTVHVVFDRNPGHDAWHNHETLHRGDSLLIEQDSVAVQNSVTEGDTGSGDVGVFMYKIVESD